MFLVHGIIVAYENSFKIHHDTSCINLIFHSNIMEISIYLIAFTSTSVWGHNFYMGKQNGSN
jgi:hypothetical protein